MCGGVGIGGHADSLTHNHRCARAAWPRGRPFDDRPIARELACDASDMELGVIQLQGEGRICISHDFPRMKSELHINSIELLAGAHAVFAFARPDDIIRLLENKSTFFCCISRQGGRLPHLNALLPDLFLWVWVRDIVLKPLFNLNYSSYKLPRKRKRKVGVQ